MKRPSIYAASVAIVSIIALSLFAAQPDQKEPPTGVFAGLHKGEPIALKELVSCFEITVFPDGPETLGFEVVEVGHDFVAVRDASGIREVRIPVYAIKSITVMRVGGK
jgi:hypothetical protein